MEPFFVIILPIMIFLTFFAALWLFICFILSRVGGWEKLARVYRYNGKFKGERWRFRSCRMNGYTNYNNCLTFGANPAGLYLKTLPMFRFQHPPLLIPWSEIREGKAKGMIITYLELTFTRAPNVRVRIIESLGEKIFRQGRQQKSAVAFPAYEKIEPH
jgi:hypothetical protein